MLLNLGKEPLLHGQLAAPAGAAVASDGRVRPAESFGRAHGDPQLFVEAMLNYYKRNYPREPYPDAGPALPKVKMPVLMFHGLKDRALLSGALNNTWDWLESDLTLVTIPSASHWAQVRPVAFLTATVVIPP